MTSPLRAASLGTLTVLGCAVAAAITSTPVSSQGTCPSPRAGLYFPTPFVTSPLTLSQMAGCAPALGQRRTVWLNFDGLSPSVPFEYKKTDSATPQVETLSAPAFYSFFFRTPAMDSTDRDLQEILFRASEFFAPFNVVVHRVTGANVRGEGARNPTVFVGSAGLPTVTETHGRTPWQNADWPRANVLPNDTTTESWADRILDSGTGEISIAVEYGGDRPNTRSERMYVMGGIAAHEAAHTFGMAHTINSWGSAGSPGELMTPASDGRMRYREMQFRNADFLMGPLSPATGQIGFPIWAGDPVRAVNPYDYLRTLTGTKSDDVTNLATPQSAAVADGPSQDLPLCGTRVIDYLGDYDVFTWRPQTPEQVVTIELSGSTLKPVVLVYSGEGESLVFFGVPDEQSTSGAVRVTFPTRVGTLYKIVVGGHDGLSQGAYRITASTCPAPPTNLRVLSVQ